MWPVNANRQDVVGIFKCLVGRRESPFSPRTLASILSMRRYMMVNCSRICFIDAGVHRFQPRDRALHQRRDLGHAADKLLARIGRIVAHDPYSATTTIATTTAIVRSNLPTARLGPASRSRRHCRSSRKPWDAPNPIRKPGAAL